MVVLVKIENKHKDKWGKDTVENKKASSSSRMTNSSVFIACFVIGIILITGLSGVVSVSAAAPSITDWFSTGGTPTYKDNPQDLIYKVQPEDTITFTVTANETCNFTWEVMRGAEVLQTHEENNTKTSSFTWTVPNEVSSWDIEVNAQGKLKAVGPTETAHLFWSLTTSNLITVAPGESIQDAMNSLPAEGGIVELTSGTFVITSTILINKSNVILRGAGMDKTVIDGSSGEFTVIMVHDSLDIHSYPVELSNVTIADMYIKSSGGRSSGWGIAFVYVRKPKVSSVHAENCSNVVRLRNTLEAEIAYSLFRNKKGIVLWSLLENQFGEKTWIHHNTIDGGTDTSEIIEFNRLNEQEEQIYPNSYAVIEHNTIYNAANDGVFLYSACGYATVRYNHIYNCRDNSIYVVFSSGHEIYGNILSDTYKGSGVTIGEEVTNVEIHHNILLNNKIAGISIYQSKLYSQPPKDIKIYSNTIYENEESGIKASHTAVSGENIIKNNIIANNDQYGIYMNLTGGSFTIDYNDVWGNPTNYQGCSAGANDISIDPLFADVSNYDFHLKSQAGRWSGTTLVYDPVTSPCIDAGDPSEKDPDGTRMNMGAYGGTREASKSQSHGSHGIETYNISGYVKYANGTGIYNAYVTNNVTSAEDYTNESGYYILTNFTNGTYNITASKPGFYSNSIIESILGANEEYANITLTEIVDSDTKSPTISNVSYSLITATRATITWDTDELSTSSVKYGTSPGIYTRTRSDTSYVTSHSITLTGLTPNTTYYFVVNSTDKAGNSAESDEHSFITLSVPQEGYVILWDTNKKYTEKNPFSDALADKANWTQVPYGVTNYTFTGDAMIENDYYYLFLFSNDEDSPALAAKMNGGSTVQNEIYKVHDTGYRNFGMGNMWVEILKNDKDEVIVKSAEKGMRFGEPPVPITTTYTIKGGKPWLEVRPVENVNQQGMHRKQRLAVFIYKNVTKDVLIDAKKHGEFEENVYPENGCIGIVVFHREYTPPDNPSDYDFLWLLTFPPGAENNSLTYAGVHYPDPYWEWDDKPGAPSVGAVYAYLDKMVIIGVLNSKDNWKREDVGQYLNAGETYTSSFTAPYAGKWRVAGVFSDDDWNITDYFSEVEMNEGEHFTFTSPRNGTLEYLVMYMFDRTENTPENITTIMDVYRETMGITPDITSPAKVNDLVASNPTQNSITLTWTAPGDDGNTGTAAQYDIRYSTSEITEENWNSATQCTGEPAPKPAGSSETFTVTGLSPNTTYYFALKTADEVPNWSPISNSPSGKTTQVAGGLVGYWKFDEGAGTTAVDSSGNNNNGTLIDNPDWVDGKIGKALEFNGSTNYVEINDSDSLDGFDEITIEAWVKPILGQRGAVVSRYLYDYNIPINERVYELTVEQGGTIGFALSSDGSSATWLESNNTVQNNEWNHIAAVSDGNTMRIYINGEQDPNTKAAPASLHSSSYNLQIGTWEYSPNQRDTYFNGVIDEVKIYNRALSAEEIKADYEAGIPPASSSISGFVTYACNETGLAGATVNLSLWQPGNGNGNGNETPAIKSTVTDSNGSYMFINVYPGTYNITASRRGFWSNSSSVTVTGTPASESYTLNLTLWLKGDLNNNGKPADDADVVKMENASIGNISPDWRYDLNRNSIAADAGDLAMIIGASAGNLIVLE